MNKGDEKMDNEFIVTIDCKNKETNVTSKRSYTLSDYTQMIGLELKRIIMDVEDVLYDLEGGRQKDQWDESVKTAFGKIRHKLLDCANGVERIPINTKYNGVPCSGVKMSDYITALINGEIKNEE